MVRLGATPKIRRLGFWKAVKHCVENHLPRVFRETLRKSSPSAPQWMGATDLFHTKSQWRPWLSSRTCHNKNTFGESCPPETSLTPEKVGGCCFCFANPWFAKPPFWGWFFKPTFSSNSLLSNQLDHCPVTEGYSTLKGSCFFFHVHQKPKCSGQKSRIQLQKIHMWQMSWSNAPFANKPPSTGIPWVAESRNLQILKSSI